jgi:hypothetical protein
MAAARQKEINVSMAVVATMTRGTVMMRGESGLLPAGIEAIRRKYFVKILYWHVGRAMSSAELLDYLSSIILSPLNGYVKMSPYETGDIAALSCSLENGHGLYFYAEYSI